MTQAKGTLTILDSDKTSACLILALRENLVQMSSGDFITLLVKNEKKEKKDKNKNGLPSPVYYSTNLIFSVLDLSSEWKSCFQKDTDVLLENGEHSGSTKTLKNRAGWRSRGNHKDLVRKPELSVAQKTRLTVTVTQNPNSQDTDMFAR